MKVGERAVRAIYRAIHVENASSPYDTINAKVYYPASFTNSDLERNTGLIPVDTSDTPYPVVIILPGINVGPESYAWLAKDIAVTGKIVVTYQWIAEEMPGFVSLTPGLEMAGFTPEGSGKAPNCPALQPILDDLDAMNADGLLAGTIDTSTVFIGGHSAGGSVSLLNANKKWFPKIKGVFSYAAHSGAAVALGWEDDTVLALDEEMPVLLMGGTADGVIASSSHRYGKSDDDSPTHRIERTFDEGVSPGNGSALIFVDGANHFSCVHPYDDATGRPFLDMPETVDAGAFRDFLVASIIEFIDGIRVGKPPEDETYGALASDALTISVRTK